MIPEYTIRESARAKHVRIQVSVSDGIVVVVPHGFDQSQIPELLKDKQAWLARAQQRIAAHRKSMSPPDQKPEEIELPSIGQTWRLHWVDTDKSGVAATIVGQQELQVSGSIQDKAAWQLVLRQWLVERGREHLIPWTESLSQELGIPIQRVSIRCQKTRWGSYSSKGTVTLNAQLLLLPRRLARYVLIHEICHAIHQNHSPKFWNLVRRWEPEADQLRLEIRRASRFVPGWVQPGHKATTR